MKFINVPILMLLCMGCSDSVPENDETNASSSERMRSLQVSDQPTAEARRAPLVKPPKGSTRHPASHSTTPQTSTLPQTPAVPAEEQLLLHIEKLSAISAAHLDDCETMQLKIKEYETTHQAEIERLNRVVRSRSVSEQDAIKKKYEARMKVAIEPMMKAGLKCAPQKIEGALKGKAQ